MPLLSTLQALRDFDTALVANTIEYIDPTPPEEWYVGGSVQSVTPSLAPTVGVAFTCEMDSSTPGGSARLDPFWKQVEEISQAAIPALWVVKCVGARPDHECVLGDGMGKILFAAGCLGVVTDGGVRDVEGLLAIPFAAYCHGRTVHHCALRMKATNQPVEIGAITIRSGDVLHAGADGVIRIPAACLETLAGRAAQMRKAEHDAHCELQRTDLSAANKQQRVEEIFREHGFGKD
jgi:4-hydroxy-4-methyl-2-oxoglutarate aldolase